MWINKSLDNANIEMKFGKLKTKSITYANIRLKNGEINIENSKDLKITSSGTQLNIENVESLELHSSKDKIVINKIGKIEGELMFSNMNLNTVIEKVNLSMEVADVWISNIENANANIIINQESSELNINIAGTFIDFNASLEQGLLRIPKSFTNITTNVIDKRRRLREIKASYGSIPHKGDIPLKGNIQINGKKGIIILKE